MLLQIHNSGQQQYTVHSTQYTNNDSEKNSPGTDFVVPYKLETQRIFFFFYKFSYDKFISRHRLSRLHFCKHLNKKCKNENGE